MKQSEARALIHQHITIDPDGCWLWIKQPKRKYPHIWIDGRHYIVHRLAYMAYRGPIPHGMFVCHHCDIPRCVNPDHLFLGTHAQNMRDMANKDRGGTRELNHPFGKLTDEQVREIRAKRARGFPSAWLARDYGVTPTYIRAITSKQPRPEGYIRYHADDAQGTT